MALAGLANHRGALVAAAIAAASFAPCSDSQRYPISLHGSIEEYDWAFQKDGEWLGRQRARWIHGELKLTPDLTLVGGELKFYGRTTLLDENYVRFERDLIKVRLGRFRPRFGFNDWEEMWYSGFIRPPLVKMAGISYDASLLGFVDGIEVAGGNPELQYSASVADGTPDRYQLAPKRINAYEGRLQLYKGGAIIGFNGIVRPAMAGNDAVNVYGIDLRYTLPEWQFRTEVIRSQAGPVRTEGFYADGFYKPFGLPQTTFILRVESASRNDSKFKESSLLTVGVKQALTSWLQFDVLHSWGNNGTLSGSAKGWAVQLITFVRF